jgi:hypothetical protein
MSELLVILAKKGVNEPFSSSGLLAFGSMFRARFSPYQRNTSERTASELTAGLCRAIICLCNSILRFMCLTTFIYNFAGIEYSIFDNGLFHPLSLWCRYYRFTSLMSGFNIFKNSLNGELGDWCAVSALP